MSEFLAEINWSPLWISLKTGFAATVIAFFLGIFFARLVMKMKPVSRGILDGILTMPLVLPPTVAGFILLLLFSLRRPFGAFLLDNFDIKIVQTWKGCVIAASVIAFPLMYRNARAAFEQVDVNLIAAGKTLGMSDRRIFWTVVMPTAGPGIASGTVLAFARAIGEYGARRKHSWQDQNRFRCHCFGDCGRKLWHGRFLGSCDLDHFICDRCGDQYRFW